VPPIHLLAISGSLRNVSTNTALLRAAALVAPAEMTIELYDGLTTLPHFNPDLDIDPPPAAVVSLRRRIGAADGLLISSPEYARGVPGSLKNALDWLVSSDVFPGKPVALLHASERNIASRAALQLILETMSARMVNEAAITLPLLGTETDARTIAGDPSVAEKIRDGLTAFAHAIRTP
jgi:chromate reductase, NAD(P)H dehydrogenase (quinone)